MDPHSRAEAVGVRWTVGDVSDRGFEALRLSIAGAVRIFGPAARYAVAVNTIDPATARRRTGPVPDAVKWVAVGPDDLPSRLRPHLDGGMAEGVAWKLAPLRLFPDRWELSLDNDCILWALPPSLERWLAGPADRSLAIAADVRAMFGVFTDACGPEPRNTGIRGLPPEFDLEAALLATVGDVRLATELDEQGLQVAAFLAHGDVTTVSTDEVTIASPFHPHQEHLGTHGAHFVGLNARTIPWEYYGRPATEVEAEFWARHRPALRGKVGLGEAAVG
jgi:hypothetical protein